MSQKKALLPFLKSTALLLLVLLLGGCAQERDLRNYYFPARRLSQGLVYAYERLGSPDTTPIYWYVLGVDQDTALHLTVTTYGPDFTPSSLVQEAITPGGVMTRSLTLYSTDSSGRSTASAAEVLAGHAFPFRLPSKKRPAYVYQVRYHPPGQAPELRYTLTYNRQFSHDTSLNVLGQPQQAIVLRIVGETDLYDPQNGSLSPRFSGYEIYARGLGLVESYRNFGNLVLHQRLQDTFGMPELQRQGALKFSGQPPPAER